MKSPLFLSALAVVALSGPLLAEDRVVSIGGSVTEIVYALGQGDRVIARDTTSRFPPSVGALPDVGYMRALSPEGVLSVDPTLILAEEGSGPVETIRVLEAAGVPFVTIPDGFDSAAVVAKITAVGAAMGVPERGQDLAHKVETELAALDTHVAHPRRVMFILSAAGGRIMAAGSNTAADGVITLAGGQNAVTGFEGYKTIGEEAITMAAPDVILMMNRSGNHAAPSEELWALPALSTTPAAQDDALILMDGLLLLGFGPRTAEAASALHSALYPDA